MRHVTTVHAGAVIDGDMCATLVAMQRCTCTDSTCGGFRRIGARTCNRCQQATAARPPAVGDIIAGPLGAAEPAANDADEATSSSAPRPQPVGGSPDVSTLPRDFTTRVERLSFNTIIHTPKSCRMRLLRIAQECFDGIADGSAYWSLLEEGRSKLLLAPLAEGASAPEEVAERSALWESGSLEVLLQRIEQQLIISNKTRHRKRAQRSADLERAGR